MKKLIALLLSLVMVMACGAFSLADEGSEPAWAEYDALIAQIKSEPDFAVREELMHKAEDILMATAALCPIYYYNDIYLAKPELTGFYSNLYGMKYFHHATNGDNTTIRLQLASEPAKLDPALNSSVDGACLANAAFGGLYTYDENGMCVPNYATGYEVSEDGLTYTFTIRDGLVWSDGTPLTAKDFEYSWKRTANPETAADYAYMMSGLEGYPDVNVAASEDGKTFTVKLIAPCAYMLDLAAFPAFFAVQEACVENAPDRATNPGAWALEAGFVGSGPYVLESWEHNQSMVYVKNPLYWDAANVTNERLEFMLSDDDTAIYSAYQNGDLDFIDTVPTDQIASLNGIDPEFHIIDNLGTYYSCFNVKSKLFDGKTVEQAAAMRKAFALLVDRQYIIDTVGQTGQQIATSFIPAGMIDGNGGVFKSADEHTYPNGADGYFGTDVDVEGAVELLKSAGFEFDANNMLSASTPISFEYLTNNTSGHVAIAECLQQDFAAIGINMSIKSIDWAVFLNERKAGNFDVARNGWLADFNDPINMLEMWTTESGNNDVQLGK